MHIYRNVMYTISKQEGEYYVTVMGITYPAADYTDAHAIAKDVINTYFKFKVVA